MPSLLLRLDRLIEPQRSARGDVLERRLRRFRPELQPAVRSLARRHSRLADLADSFPALLVALAVPRTGFDARPVIARVVAGAPLVELATCAEIPLWLRKFAPEYFSHGVPRLPANNDFCRRIVNHCPRSRKFAPIWLDAVSAAVAWADEPFAVWVARNLVQDRGALNKYNLRLICLWGWFSGQPQTFAHGLIDRAWSPFMQGKAALEAASNWLAEVTLYANLGDDRIADVWLQPASVDGYDFVPLRTIPEIVEEARAMKNCVRRYGPYLARNSVRLWSIRKDGQRVATVEVSAPSVEPLLNIYELKAARNKDAPKEIWWAARRWLHMHGLPQLERPCNAAPLRRDSWIRLWKPYWLAKKRIPPWLPLTPSSDVLEDL